MINYPIVGTANGSKESNSLRSMGTEMRPGESHKKSQIEQFDTLMKFTQICSHLSLGEH